MAFTVGVSDIIMVVGEVGIQVADGAARRNYDKKLNELSQGQQKELSAKLATTQSNNERIRILNDYLLKIRNQGASNKIAITRNIGFIVLGLGVISLAIVLILYKKK
jgi:ribosomal protein L19